MLGSLKEGTVKQTSQSSECGSHDFTGRLYFLLDLFQCQVAAVAHYWRVLLSETSRLGTDKSLCFFPHILHLSIPAHTWFYTAPVASKTLCVLFCASCMCLFCADDIAFYNCMMMPRKVVKGRTRETKHALKLKGLLGVAHV